MTVDIIDNNNTSQYHTTRHHQNFEIFAESSQSAPQDIWLPIISSVKPLFVFCPSLAQGRVTSYFPLKFRGSSTHATFGIEFEPEDLAFYESISSLFVLIVGFRRPIISVKTRGLFIMREILAFRSRGKGTFALRKDLKALSGTVCDLRRNPENVRGTTLDGSFFY